MTTNEIQQQAPQQAPTDPDDLAAAARARGMLVSLEITTWSGRRLDKRVTAETNARAAADDDAGRYNKHLLGGKVPSFAATIAAAGAARAMHYKQTLPWHDDGARLLSTGNYFEYTQAIRQQRDAFKAAVSAFLAEYPQLVHDAAARLGSMYDPSDYPSAEEIAKRFTFRIHIAPIPAAADMRVDLPPEIVQHMQRAITARVERSVESAVREGWQRLAESVERIRDRLREINASGGRLHGALFTHAVETAETLRRLNLTNDPALDSMAARVVAELQHLDPAAVRKDPNSMESTAQAADDILQAMAGLYGAGAS